MNSIMKLLNQFFDNKMEDFETAFPAVIDELNDDGTVNVRPSIRNCLRNMQMEPTDENGKLHVVRNVPVLWCGTKAVMIDFELKAGDTVLCIASSRDIRNWRDGEWDEIAYAPLSFSGNDLLNLIAIPLCRKADDAKTKIHIDRDGAVSIETASVSITGDLKVSGSVSADGDIKAGGDVSTDGSVKATGDVTATMGTISLTKHTHTCAAPGSPTTPPLPSA